MNRRRATLLSVAVLATAFSVSGTMGEYLVGVLAPVFERELHVSGAMTGQFIAAMFFSSALMALPAGWLADNLRPARLALAQVLLSSAAFGSFALAQGAGWIFVSSVLVGASMSLSRPLANRVIVTFLPRRHHAAAVGWRSLGPQIAAMLIGMVFALTGNVLYWRITVILVTCVLVTFAIVAFLYLSRVPAADHAAADDRPGRKDIAPPSGEVRANPIVWWLIPFSFFFSGLITSIGAYLLYFATSEIGLAFQTASFAVSVVSGVSIAARVLWLRAVTPRNAVLLLMVAAISAAASALLMAASPTFGPIGFWVAALALGIFGLGSTAMPQVVLLWNTNPAHIGRVGSWSALAGSLGMTLQPLIMSIIVGAYGISSSWFVITASALCAAATMIVFAATGRARASRLR